MGRLLGASAEGVAGSLARRLLAAGTLLGCGFALVLGAGHDLIPRIFTADPAVLRQAAVLWPWLVVMMPAAGYVFALDGVLFGAGDLRFLRDVSVFGAVVGFVPLTLLTPVLDLGMTGIWAGLSAFVGLRLLLGWRRWRGRRWLVGGIATVDDLSA